MRWALTAAAALLAARAEADPQGLALSWTAPPECPSQTAVLRAVGDARGDAANASPLTVTVTVTRAGARWRAAVRTRSDTQAGERTLEARSCARLSQAVALVVALALDAEPEPVTDISRHTDRSPPTPVLFVEDGELPPVLQRRRPTAPRPAATHVSVGFSARAVLDGATLPEATGGFALGLRVGRGIFEGRLDAGMLATRRAPGPRPGAFADFGAWYVDALGCLRAGRRFEVGACVGAEVAMLTARAQGFTRSLDGDAVAVGAVLRLTGGIAVTRSLTVSIEPELLAPVTRLRWEVAGVGAVHALPAVVLRGALAATVRWP